MIDKRNRLPLSSGAAGTTDSVHVVIDILGHIVVHDQLHIRNIQPTSGQIGGDENLESKYDIIIYC
jgi:hypothetical protein